jgi:alpha-N-arabinofuranosidase
MKINIGERKGVNVNPHMIGLFFEDINYGADGGLSAELLENRSFDFFPTKIFPDISPLTAWEKVGEPSFVSNDENPQSKVNVQYASVSGKKGEGISNRAYEGIFIEKGKSYEFSLYVSGNAQLKAEVKNSDKSAAEIIFNTEGGWTKYSFSFISDETLYDAKLFITLEEDGAFDIDMVSLKPKDTFCGHGLRRDMAESLKNLKPGFMRFPGGCIVEGNGLENRYRWKETVGRIEDRKCNWNRWQDANVGVTAHDYFQSYDIGFYEYFVLCEDLGCEPLPVLNCGMGCQYQCDETADDLTEYILDALDLIEFANGDPNDGKWAALRKEMGHEKPFNLKYLGIGNEQWNEKYFERYEKFQAVIAKEHPEIKLITSSGPSASGEEFDNAKNWLKGKGEDFAYLVDEHYYVKSDWMFENVDRYDSYDRNETKVFAGEYACHLGDNQPKPNNLEAALAEGAMMCGFEKNADVVRLASYAPLFGRIGYSQWTPDLIFVNNHEVLLTPSYYVQSLFAHNLPTYTLEYEREDDSDVFVTVGFDEKSGEYILKIVNKGGKKDIVLTLPTDVSTLSETVLTANDMGEVNTMEQKNNVCPKRLTRSVGGREISLTAEKYSFNVYRIR